MKDSFYDILMINPRATPEIIAAAYRERKGILQGEANAGNEDARNHLVFLEEAYAVLSSPAKRDAYDAALSAQDARRTPSYTTSAYSGDNAALRGWEGGRTGRVLGVMALFAALFGAYKFMGQSAEQQLKNRQIDAQTQQAERDLGNDSYRAESERLQIQGSVDNQSRAIDRSYDVASREADRRRAEVEYRANAGSQQLEMQRQRLEAQLQEQKWRQEQYEKERELRENRTSAENPQKQLCTMYQLNGKTAEAQAAGCYRYR